jgi:hypothetical protein
LHRCLAVLVSRHQTNRSIRLPGPLPKVDTAHFALQPSQYFWHNFGDMTWHRELSECNSKLMRAISIDFVDCSWVNGLNIWSMKYCTVKLSPCGKRYTIAKSFGLKNCQHWFLGQDCLTNPFWELLVQTQAASFPKILT